MENKELELAIIETNKQLSSLVQAYTNALNDSDGDFLIRAIKDTHEKLMLLTSKLKIGV